YAADMSNLAMVFDQVQLYDRAIEYYKKAAELKKECSGESLSYADTLNNMAIVLNQTGKQKEALSLHHKVMEIREGKLGREHADYIHALYHVGNTYELLGKFDEAAVFHSRAMQKARQCSDFSTLDLADLHGAAARAYEGMGNYQKAIYYYEVCLDLIEKARGGESFYYMISLLTLASVCEKAGLLDLAVEYCEKAVEVRRKLYSEKHLDFLNSLNSLAAILCKAERFDRAVEIHREVLELVEKMLGKNHSFYAEALNNLSVDYAGKKEYKKALALNSKALNLKRETLGEKDPQVAASLMSMGNLYEKMEKAEDALQCYQEALMIRKDSKTLPLSAAADTYTAIGRLMEKQQKYPEAAEYVKEALKLREEGGDRESGMYVWNMHLLAELYRRQGNMDKAVALCTDAAERMEKRFGEEHPRYAIALEKLGLIHEAAGNLQKAEEILDQVAKIRKEMLDEDNPQYLETLDILARVSMKQRKFEKAIRLYQEKNDVNFEETPQEQMEAANNLIAIAYCYKMADQADKADAYFAEAEGKRKRSGIPMDEKYEKRRRMYLAEKIEEIVKEAPPKPQKTDSAADWQKAVEYYSALALSIRGMEGENGDYAKALLKAASFHAKLGNKKDTETLLDRVLYIGAKDGMDTVEFGKLCDRTGRIYAEAGSWDKAESVLRQAYQIQQEKGKCMTREGHSLLLRLLRKKGDEGAYLSVKNGENLS
ncbi:MAG: tetratricopeptide repeat protein, partial [Bacillota bacterium]|nr:tetratricopeptide repeat protein [Bacillota bacterium]